MQTILPLAWALSSLTHEYEYVSWLLDVDSWNWIKDSDCGEKSLEIASFVFEEVLSARTANFVVNSLVSWVAMLPFLQFCYLFPSQSVPKPALAPTSSPWCRGQMLKSSIKKFYKNGASTFLPIGERKLVHISSSCSGPLEWSQLCWWFFLIVSNFFTTWLKNFLSSS